jgi:hypothetical protein
VGRLLGMPEGQIVYPIAMAASSDALFAVIAGETAFRWTGVASAQSVATAVRMGCPTRK